MIFTSIHDVYTNVILEHKNEDGEVVSVEEVEKTIRKNQKTPIYLEIDDIRMIMPYFSKIGRMYKTRTVVKTHTDSYVLNHTFKELTDLKKEKYRKITGFK